MLRLFPVFLLVLLLVLFGWGLRNDPQHVPSEMIGKAVPHFQAKTLFGAKPIDQTVFQGHLTLLNIWTTTCLNCLSEQAFLLDLHKQGYALIGLNKGDRSDIAEQWLVQQGNPYRQIIFDAEGQIAMLLGVLGTPETFLIDAKGLIRYRHTGILNKETWQTEFIPLIRKLQEKRQ